MWGDINEPGNFNVNVLRHSFCSIFNLKHVLFFSLKFWLFLSSTKPWISFLFSICYIYPDFVLICVNFGPVVLCQRTKIYAYTIKWLRRLSSDVNLEIQEKKKGLSLLELAEILALVTCSGWFGLEERSSTNSRKDNEPDRKTHGKTPNLYFQESTLINLWS